MYVRTYVCEMRVAHLPTYLPIHTYVHTYVRTYVHNSGSRIHRPSMRFPAHTHASCRIHSIYRSQRIRFVSTCISHWSYCMYGGTSQHPFVHCDATARKGHHYSRPNGIQVLYYRFPYTLVAGYLYIPRNMYVYMYVRMYVYTSTRKQPYKWISSHRVNNQRKKKGQHPAHPQPQHRMKTPSRKSYPPP